MGKQSRVKGIAVSYITTAVRTVSKLLLLPIYIRKLGMDAYGFYQYVFSIASYATILDFGISSVISKFMIEYREKDDADGVENVLFFTMIFVLAASALIVLGGIIIGKNAVFIFGDKVIDQLDLTRRLLALMLAELVLLRFQHLFEGVILAEEKYVTHRVIALLQILLRCAFTLALLYSNVGVEAIALGDFLGVLVCLVFEGAYAFGKLKLKIRYHYYDSRLISAIVKLSSALCIQSIVSYLNSSIDKYVLGRIINDAVVTVYSVALTFSALFDEMPTVIQRLYLPLVVRKVSEGASGEELTDVVIKPGRYQFIICGGMLGGFLLFGMQFIGLWQHWSGDNARFAWLIAVLLMVPSVLPLIQNVCLSILTAMNRRMFRSYVLCAIAALNLLVTVILVKQIGLLGAPIATCISLILGNNIAMNLYYSKAIKINVRRLFASILKGILPCAAVTTLLCSLLLLVPMSGWSWFLAECVIFCIVYAFILWRFGLNDGEKHDIAGVIRKYLKKIKK